MPSSKWLASLRASSSSFPSAKQAVLYLRCKSRLERMIEQCRWWLKLKKSQNDTFHVVSLSCLVCLEFDNRLQGLRIETKNCSAAFVVGVKNLQFSNFKDHVKTEMQSKAMSLYCQKTALSISEGPIVRALLRMDSTL